MKYKSCYKNILPRRGLNKYDIDFAGSVNRMWRWECSLIKRSILRLRVQIYNIKHFNRLAFLFKRGIIVAIET